MIEVRIFLSVGSCVDPGLNRSGFDQAAQRALASVARPVIFPDMKTPLLRFLFASLVLGCLAPAAVAAEEGKWISLFDGKTLNGWKQLQAQAKFAVEDGAIVGRVTEGVTRNSFLVTEQEFGDFIFECEFKAAPGINSGVQFRSQPENEKVKHVHGYQYEIDPNPRALTGGLYEEGRRGWFAPTKNNGEPQQAWAAANASKFKDGEWNTMRIEARGNRIRTWLNGHLMTDWVDKDEDVRIKRGFFGLQVHSTTRPEAFGRPIAFRNLRVMKLD